MSRIGLDSIDSTFYGSCDAAGAHPTEEIGIDNKMAKTKRVSREPIPQHVLTVRLDRKVQEKLNRYALQRSAKEGRRVSLNECVTQLIENAVG